MPVKYKPWTTKDLEFMRLMYPTDKAKTIAEEMGRTYTSVVWVMKRYGIKKPNRKQHAKSVREGS